MRSVGIGFAGLLAAAAAGVACQSYNMEQVDPQTVVAVETSGQFNVGKAPNLLVVQDRSGSMKICFGDEPAGPGEACNLDGGRVADIAKRSRMNVAQGVMVKAVSSHQEDVQFGLVVYGVGDSSLGCDEPLEITAPGAGTAATMIDAYTNDPAITNPRGGTPTTKALEHAFEVLVDPATGKVKDEGRDNYVVLVTDGLMNCNSDHPVREDCVCTQESGKCPTVDGGAVSFGERGHLTYSEMCLDDDLSVAMVTKLRNAGVKTFVIGLGESFTGGGSQAAIGIQTLDRLAEAGGVAREGAGEKFYSAADEGQLEAALDEIINKIVVPCEYELDGPVCDGRLIAVTLKVDGEQVKTVCSADADENSWRFVERADGTLDDRRITFSQDLCTRFGEARQVEISIRGVENGCGEVDGVPTSPSCDPTR